jgi:hypothetical protein
MVQTAAYEGYLEIVKFLISIGASTDIVEIKLRSVIVTCFKEDTPG